MACRSTSSLLERRTQAPDRSSSLTSPAWVPAVASIWRRSTTVRQAIPDVTLLVGGGIRGVDDLRDLAAVGCDGVLVATALHASGGASLVRFAAVTGPSEDKKPG